MEAKWLKVSALWLMFLYVRETTSVPIVLCTQRPKGFIKYAFHTQT